jgi:NADPH2:quinone reductase
MNAAYYTQTGGPEVITYGELPTPEPEPGQVRVRVEAAALNPIDTYIRSGAVQMPRPEPTVPGCDFAGIIDAVGAGVEQFTVGDLVWGSNQGLLGRQGTFADFVCPEAHFCYPMPEKSSFEEAAALALVGITAHIGLVQLAQARPGETVFVQGGTGGVGSCVVQMAKAIGCTVFTTAGGPDKCKAARELGADAAIDYKGEDVAERLKELTGGKGVNVWYETQREQDFMTIVPAMAARGRIVVMAGRTAQPPFPTGPFYVKGLSMFGFAMFNFTPEEQRRAADDLNRWVGAGKLKAHVGRRFAMREAADAHRLQEENTLNKAGTLAGKIVLIKEN